MINFESRYNEWMGFDIQNLNYYISIYMSNREVYMRNFYRIKERVANNETKEARMRGQFIGVIYSLENEILLREIKIGKKYT